MDAIEYDEHGGPDVLQQRDVPAPQPQDGQVLVTVHAAGVNPLEVKLREGQIPGQPPFPSRPGSEFAGVVADPHGRDELAAGTAVFGWAESGAYAQQATSSVLAPIPAGLDEDVAAGLPVAGEAAVRGLRLLAVSDGDVLLLHGASGSVGRIATQLAVRTGARVIAPVAERDQEALRELGAEPVVYGDGWVERVREQVPAVDAVLDAAGAGLLRDSVDLAGGSDRVVTLADPEAFALGITFSGDPEDKTVETLTTLGDLVAGGGLRIRQGPAFPLAEAAQAQEALSTSPGKVTLRP